MTTTATPGLRVETQVTENAQLIGGEWAPAGTGEPLDVLDPATGQPLLRVPRSGAADVDAAVRAAEEAFPAWRNTSPRRRGALLYRWAELCREYEHELGTLEAMEVGRPPLGPPPMSMMLTYTAGQADKVTGQTLPTDSPNTLGMTLREPYGVCGSIIPWNAPGPLMVSDVGPAIAVGNTIVVKPAEDAPLTCLLLARLAMEAGIPPGVVNVVTGYGSEAGAALPENPRVRHVSFTGSPETGSAIMAACARNLTPIHLELGGKSPQVVLSDADLDKAVPTIVRSITMMSGQVCAAGSRLLVEEGMRDRVVEAVADAFGKVRVGPWHEDVQMGPLINQKQEKRVLGYLDIGRQEGAEVVTGGHKLTGDKFSDGYFVEPTIFDRVSPDMRIAQEEIFGPVLSVIGYEDEEEALAIANGTKYGLVASVWTNDVNRAIRLARNVDAGQVSINAFASRGVIGAPFGGYKSSGFGRKMSAESILEWTQTKTIVLSGED